MKKIISILLILVIISCKGEKATINNENKLMLFLLLLSNIDRAEITKVFLRFVCLRRSF